MAEALFDLGVVLGELGRSEDAVAAYDQVIARYGDADSPALAERVAKALVNKGARLGVLGRSEDAVAAYDQVIARYGDADSPALAEQVAKARVGIRMARSERPTT